MNKINLTEKMGEILKAAAKGGIMYVLVIFIMKFFFNIDLVNQEFEVIFILYAALIGGAIGLLYGLIKTKLQR